MGGPEMSLEEKYRWILVGEGEPDGTDPCVLNTGGVLTLARLDLLPSVEEAMIKARSKAEQLPKTLVCFQAIWISIQVFARKAAELPRVEIPWPTWAVQL